MEEHYSAKIMISEKMKLGMQTRPDGGLMGTLDMLGCSQQTEFPFLNLLIHAHRVYLGKYSVTSSYQERWLLIDMAVTIKCRFACSIAMHIF